ncbi:MAG: SDR family oxidoreductase [Candidatus Yanofskybacteria bacterium]|nr:SDR family oxidoreductase [Candidatus Yanofskybacteria bacterium]
MKTAVITGSSSGIGKSICDLILKMGFKVYGISRSSSNYDSPNFVWIQADLADYNSFSHISGQITEDAIDVLVNNAGIAFEQDALDFNEKDFKRLFDINFKAPILLVKELKKKIKQGLVINISSVSDRLVGEKYALYCSSKAALNTYFDVAALEEKNMKIISILPSYIDTPLLRKLQEHNKDFDWNLTMKPEQIAEFVERIINDNKDLSSGAKVIVVSDSLKEDLEYNENLWGYNVTTKELLKVKQN